MIVSSPDNVEVVPIERDMGKIKAIINKHALSRHHHLLKCNHSGGLQTDRSNSPYVYTSMLMHNANKKSLK